MVTAIAEEESCANELMNKMHKKIKLTVRFMLKNFWYIIENLVFPNRKAFAAVSTNVNILPALH